MEGCALPEAFAMGELVDLGLRAVGAILGVDLLGQSAWNTPLSMNA
jgi:hypothetical protein